jgi:hypothetical protein
VRDAEFLEHCGGVLHRFPIGRRAHNDGDERVLRSGFRFSVFGFWHKKLIFHPFDDYSVAVFADKTFSAVNITDLVRVFGARFPVKRPASARRTFIRKRQAATVGVRGFTLTALADLFRVALEMRRDRGRANRAIVRFVH